ncbi:hypothetical protein Tco_1007100 [Tanacetum coccineum]
MFTMCSGYGMDGVPRVGIPRPLRASMQDLYNRMGRMEIRQEAIERMEYRQSYHWDRYQGVFEHMAGVYSVPIQGSYNPPASAAGEDCRKYSKSLLLLVVELLLLVLVTTARRISAVSYKKCKVLTEDVVRSLSALIYYRDLDTTTLRDLIDSKGKLIPEDPQPGVPRVGIPRPPRVSMQDLYDRMGRMEIRQGDRADEV